MSFNNPCTYHIPALEKPLILFQLVFFFSNEGYTVEYHEPSIFLKFLSFLPPVSIGNSMNYVVIFGINTTSYISKLLYVILRQF